MSADPQPPTARSGTVPILALVVMVLMQSLCIGLCLTSQLAPRYVLWSSRLVGAIPLLGIVPCGLSLPWGLLIAADDDCPGWMRRLGGGLALSGLLLCLVGLPVWLLVQSIDA